MNKFITFICSLMVFFSTQAQYKILQINTPSITISGKELHKGDIFNDPAVIAWSNERQAMKILDMKSQLQKLIVAKEYKKVNVDNISAFLKGKKDLSSRDGADNIISLKEKTTGEFFLQDSISFSTTYPTNDRQFFFISYMHNGEEINKRVENKEGTFLITTDIFTIDGIPYEPFDTSLSVFYVDSNKDEITLITDAMVITIIKPFTDD